MKKSTVNFQKEFKLWKACSKDEFRPVMQHVFFKDGYAYASDTHVLVRVPLEECTTFEEEERELLDGCLLHGSMLKYIVGFETVLVETDEDGAVYLKAKAGENTITVKLGKDGDALTYPKAEELLQKHRNGDRSPIQKIGINPKFVASLTEALGTDNLKFEFSDEKSAIFARPLNESSNAIGLIMPLAIMD
jgi:hypothetical protein